MYQNLLNRLAEASRALQINEELYLQKYQELNGYHESFFSSIQNNNIINTNNTINNNIDNYDSIGTNQTQNFLSINSTAKKLDVAKERNKEIDIMVNTVNELKKIFEEDSNMAIFQVTILDRIDYNTYQSRHHY